MIIDTSLVVAATEEAEVFRQHYSSFTPKSTPRTSYSPQYSDNHEMRRMTPPTVGRRLRLKRTLGNSPSADTDRDTNGSEASSGDGYFCSPSAPARISVLSQRWNHNMVSHATNSSIHISSPKALDTPNPWLSAIPRSTDLPDVAMGVSWRNKRRAEEVDGDDQGYDGEESSESVTDEKSADEEKPVDGDASTSDSIIGGMEKKAAWLLMKLSVKDGERAGENLGCDNGKPVDVGPRVKRRRATSM
jgi:hypothetical protein